MIRFIRKYIWTTLLLPLLFTTPVFAAAPDGAGPWADTVASTAQGLRNDGSAVPSVRSDPTAALGVAEQTNADGTFYSLGFGGSITLGFVNGISGGSMVFESTNLPYPTETAKVEFSENGTTWVSAGTVARTGTVNQPNTIKCAKFVRITDTSDKSQFEPTADGYDVDGVKALGKTCTPVSNPCPPRLTILGNNGKGKEGDDKKCCDHGRLVTSGLVNGNKNHKDDDDKKCCDDGRINTDNLVTTSGTNQHSKDGCEDQPKDPKGHDCDHTSPSDKSDNKR